MSNYTGNKTWESNIYIIEPEDLIAAGVLGADSVPNIGLQNRLSHLKKFKGTLIQGDGDPNGAMGLTGDVDSPTSTMYFDRLSGSFYRPSNSSISSWTNITKDVVLNVKDFKLNDDGDDNTFVNFDFNESENVFDFPVEDYVTGTDQNLTNPELFYVLGQFLPGNISSPPFVTQSTFLSIGTYEWQSPHPAGTPGDNVAWINYATSNTYGQIKFYPFVVSNWNNFAGPEYDGIKTFNLPRLAPNDGLGGYFQYYYSSSAWTTAFSSTNSSAIIAQNGSVYKDSISTDNLVVRFDGAIGLAGGGTSNDYGFPVDTKINFINNANTIANVRVKKITFDEANGYVLKKLYIQDDTVQINSGITTEAENNDSKFGVKRTDNATGTVVFDNTYFKWNESSQEWSIVDSNNNLGTINVSDLYIDGILGTIYTSYAISDQTEFDSVFNTQAVGGTTTFSASSPYFIFMKSGTFELKNFLVFTDNNIRIQCGIGATITLNNLLSLTGIGTFEISDDATGAIEPSNPFTVSFG